MQFSLKLDIPELSPAITYRNSFLLIGSCFTEHISERLQQYKFKVCSNPHGILFNPLSVSDSLNRYVSGKEYEEDDLFYLNELWNSWEHHTQFSDIDKNTTLNTINTSLKEATEAVRKADYIMITLGSAFQYFLTASQKSVSNNHRAPGQWFEKRLLETEVIKDRLQHSMESVLTVNRQAKFIFTISPVRHIRDGIIANNRSKARLLEAVHELCETNENSYYFPAYELVVDVLRDYRFYDIDFVHPNYMATQFVWEQFVKSCVSAETQSTMQRVREIALAMKHRPRFPETQAHRQFRADSLEKTERLLLEYPFLDLQEERTFFKT